jgi:preprotein translocase subunit SecG
MLHTFVNGLHIFVCLFLILTVLLQQGRHGGGLTGGLGGGAAQVFGGRGTANFMQRVTGVIAALFMLTSVTLAYLSSAGDREMKAFDEQQEDR